MNEQLMKFIELCLIDGLITDKEREVIFRKSEELGVPKDECEIILEGLLHKINLESKTESSKNEEDSTQKKEKLDVDILGSYVDKEDVKGYINNLEKVEERIKYLDENLEKLFKDFKNENLEERIKNDSWNQGIQTVKRLLSVDGGFFKIESKQSLEYQQSYDINGVLKKETFWGYSGERDIDKELKTEEIVSCRYDRLLYTNKKMYCIQGVKGLNEYSSGIGWYIEYDKILSPVKYYIHKNYKFLSLSYKVGGENVLYFNHDENGYDFKERYLNSIEIFKSLSLLNFFKDFIEKTDLSVFKEIKNLNIPINNNIFLEKIKSQELPDELINQLMRINDYIDRSVSDFNLTIDRLESGQTNIISITGVNILPRKLMVFYKSKIEHILSILQLRDNLLNMYLTNDIVSGQEIYLKLENLGVFLNKFERVSLEKLDSIINVLIEINNSIIEGFSSLSSSLDNIQTSLSTMSKSLDSINSSIGLNNLIQGISAYQLYKINKSLKQ